MDVAPFLLAVAPAPLSQLAAVDEDEVDAEELPKVLRALRKHGLRPPSEAEWEYACRGGFAGAFAHDDEIPRQTAPEPNGFGLHAMGSALEACADGYHPSYDGAPTASLPWKGARSSRGDAEEKIGDAI